MPETRTITNLPAPPERVWAVLTDFAGYERWHPLLRVSGEASPGGQIRYSRRLSLKSNRWITVDADIVEVAEPARLAWRQGVRRIFASDESFVLEAAGTGTKLTHTMRNSGLLAVVFAALSKRKNKASMDLFDGLLARRLAKGPPQPRRPPAQNARRSRRRGGR